MLFDLRVTVAYMSPKWIPATAIPTMSTDSITAESKKATLVFLVPNPHVLHVDMA